MSVASLLLLADGRFPDGTHAHSHGLEAAVGAGRVHDTRSLGDYVTGRLWTSGRPDEAALGSAHGTAAALTAAGLRLLSLDPFDVAAVLHHLRPEVDGVAVATI